MKKCLVALGVAIATLAGCGEERPNIASITAEQWRAAESWCTSLQGIRSATVREYLYFCGRGCGYKLDFVEVIATCQSGQSVSQRYKAKREE